MYYEILFCKNFHYNFKHKKFKNVSNKSGNKINIIQQLLMSINNNLSFVKILVKYYSV